MLFTLFWKKVVTKNIEGLAYLLIIIIIIIYLFIYLFIFRGEGLDSVMPSAWYHLRSHKNKTYCFLKYSS